MPYRKVRPHTSEKVERNRQLIKFYLKNRERMTYADIAKHFGISPSRVQQIIKRSEKK